jgi:hypothetical protein
LQHPPADDQALDAGRLRRLERHAVVVFDRADVDVVAAQSSGDGEVLSLGSDEG